MYATATLTYFYGWPQVDEYSSVDKVHMPCYDLDL